MKKKNLLFFLVIIFSLFLQIHNLKVNNFLNSNEGLEELTNSNTFEPLMEDDDDDIILRYNSNECLLEKPIASEVLRNKYSINDDNPDENVRFILGRCSPVLLVPGIYSTKLRIEINCNYLSKQERDTTFKKLRIYCSDSVCSNESNEHEEFPLFLGIWNSQASIVKLTHNDYNSCLGFLMNFFQKDNECPKVDNKNICYYSKGIRVSYYGASKETEDKGECGVRAIENLVQTKFGPIGEAPTKNSFNNKASESFHSIISRLTTRGYKPGFSLGAIPNDYRRYLATNDFAKKAFRYQIENLYKNTGKPVVIIAHSFGTLLTLTNLVREEHKDLIPKIKKFVALAPPFSGSAKLTRVFFFGDDTWEINKLFVQIMHFDNFGQLLLYKSLPTIPELRPLPMAAKIFTDSSYKELGDAIRERLAVENACLNDKKMCSNLEAKKFDSYFKGYFPSLEDKDCANDEIKGNKETLNKKCFTGIFNVGDCPTFIIEDDNMKTDEKPKPEDFCNNFKDNYYYQGDCRKDRKCLDDLYFTNNPDVFSAQEQMDFLYDRYYTKYKEKLTWDDFDKTEFISDGIRKSISHQKETSLIKDLPLPPVDTDLVYASFFPTIVSMGVGLDIKKRFSNYYYPLTKFGDGTVPSWSSLLTGLKWIYDKYKNPNLKQKIRLIEYCSRLSKSEQYKYDGTKEQKFAAIGCSCLNKNNEYLTTEDEIKNCDHANMLTDNNLIDYLVSIIDDPKEEPQHNDLKKQALLGYNKINDYKQECDKKLLQLYDSEE